MEGLDGGHSHLEWVKEGYCRKEIETFFHDRRIVWGVWWKGSPDDSIMHDNPGPMWSSRSNNHGRSMASIRSFIHDQESSKQDSSTFVHVFYDWRYSHRKNHLDDFDSITINLESKQVEIEDEDKAMLVVIIAPFLLALQRDHIIL